MLSRTLSIRVYGRVQGVWFRASTKNKADQLGLTGNVRNMPDGSVYIEVCGSQPELDTFIAWCHEGPELARVDRLETQEIGSLSTHSFDVIR